MAREKQHIMVKVEKVAHLKGHQGGIYSLAAYHSKTFFAASSDMFVSQWSLDNFENTGFNIKVPSQAYSICILHRKEIMFIGTFKGDIHVIDIVTKRELKLLRNHNAAVLSIATNLDESYVMAASADGNISVIDTENFVTSKVVSLCAEKVRSIRPYQSQDFIVAAGDGKIRVIDGLSFEVKLAYAAHDLSANIAIYQANHAAIISGGRDAHLKKYELNNETLELDIPAHNYALYDILHLSSLGLVVTASRDKTIKLWKADNLDFLLRINKENYDAHVNSVNCLLYHEELLISGSDDRTMMVWNLKK
jgi:WD40 repeat protein